MKILYIKPKTIHTRGRYRLKNLLVLTNMIRLTESNLSTTLIKIDTKKSNLLK